MPTWFSAQTADLHCMWKSFFSLGVGTECTNSVGFQWLRHCFLICDHCVSRRGGGGGYMGCFPWGGGVHGVYSESP